MKNSRPIQNANNISMQDRFTLRNGRLEYIDGKPVPIEAFRSMLINAAKSEAEWKRLGASLVVNAKKQRAA